MTLFRIQSLALYGAIPVLAFCGCAQTPDFNAKVRGPSIESVADFWRVGVMNAKTQLDSKSCDYKDSKGKDQCRVSVEMSFSGDVCTAEVKGYLTVPQKKMPTIVWMLVQPVGLPQNFSFPERYGIIIVDDQDDQIDSKNKPGTGGTGDGDKSDLPNQFYWLNKNSKPARAKIADIYYLPAVQWKRKEADGTTNLMLCRAIDPRIVNQGD